MPTSPGAWRNGGAAVARVRVRKRPQAIQDLADIAPYLAEESGNHELGFRQIESGIEVIRAVHAKRDIEAIFEGKD